MFVEHTTRTREEVLELCRTKPEEAAELILTLLSAVARLEERVQQLEEQLKQNSQNSNRPPSSDGFKRSTGSSQPKSNRGAGGQQGHTGSTLKMTSTPDKIVSHSVERCRCGCSLKRVPVQQTLRRQVIDIPAPHVEIIEHQSEVKHCPRCGETAVAPFPDGIEKNIQYGAHIKSFAVSLIEYQLIPLKRAQELLYDLFHITISQGTLVNWIQELHTKLQPVQEEIVAQLKQAPITHVDETGMFCQNKLHWVHVTGTPRLTLMQIHHKRGSEAIDDIGILSNFNGRAIHDFWSPYFNYTIEHGICNAHVLRELTAAYENDKQPWAQQMKNLLLRIYGAVEKAKQHNKNSLSASTRSCYRKQYRTVLQQAQKVNPRAESPPGKRGKPKQTKVRNLIDRLSEHQDAVLAFLDDFRVPFTNNQAENDLRMSKVKQKISGTFRSRKGAEAFCRIRSYISTACKNARSAFDAIVMAFMGNPFIPKNCYAE